MNRTLKLFIQFLHKEGALRAFQNYRQKAVQPHSPLQIYNWATGLSLGHLGSTNYIVDAFSWCNTNEGDHYWQALHDKWVNKLAGRE